VLGTALFFIPNEHEEQSPPNYEQVTFHSKSMSDGVPNSVVFNYNLSGLSFDSAFIQQSWDHRKRVRISADHTSQTCIYYLPGFYTAKLIVNDSVVRQHQLHITTKGWQAIVQSEKKEVPTYVPIESSAVQQLYVSPNVLEQHHVDLSAPHQVSYFYSIDNSQVNATDFTFETQIKNALSEGALVCQYCYIVLMCDEGQIQIPLSEKGCISNINAQYGKRYVNGKKHDLSAFGCDMNKWHTVTCKVKKRNLTILLDQHEIAKERVKGKVGKILGIEYRFYGCGAVKYTQLEGQTL